MKAVAIVAAVLALGCAGQAAYWGVAGDFADLDPDVSAQVAPAFAGHGANAVLLNVRGRERGWFNWTKVQKAWEGAAFSVFWDAPSTLSECDLIRGFGDEPATMSGEPLNRGRSFLSPRWASEVQQTAASMAFRVRSTAGYRVSASLGAEDVGQDHEALANWQAFLEAFFGDKSPSTDTNGDTTTFNGTYNTAHATWKDVGLFGQSALTTDERKRRLVDLWLKKAHADYVGDMCGTLAPLTKDALNGPSVDALRSRASDVSLLASRTFVKRIYSGEAESIPVIDSAAALFGKRVIAAGLPLVQGDAAASRTGLMKLLPYIDGAFFSVEAVASEESRNASACGIIAELAPFAGKLQVNRPKVLWVVPSDVPFAHVLDSYIVSECALALDPSGVDMTRFDAVIYLNSSPSISTSVIVKLFDYAVKGGTVFLDAYNIGQGITLHGRDNGHHWWEDMRVERDKAGAGETRISLGAQTWTVDGTFPYLSATEGKLSQVGGVEDSTGREYPLLLVRKLGKSGKWVFINVPESWNEFGMLRAVVKDQSGIDLPEQSRARTYTGPGCALAIGGGDSAAVSIACAYNQAVVFDISSLTASTAKPSEASLALPGKIDAGDAKVYVVKEYGRPVVLYTDGVFGQAASIDDGEYDGTRLRFRYAKRAFVSSPSRPTGALVDGKAAAFEYDSDSRLVRLVGPPDGGVVPAELHYEN